MRLFSLPMFDLGQPGGTPSVDRVRRRLGGRATSEPGVGQLVQLPGPVAAGTGVVVFVAGDEWHVLSAAGVVRKTRATACSPLVDDAADLAAIAGDARSFADLREG